MAHLSIGHNDIRRCRLQRYATLIPAPERPPSNRPSATVQLTKSPSQLARRRSRLQLPPNRRRPNTGLRQHQHLGRPRPRPSQADRRLRIRPRLRLRPRGTLLPAPRRPHHLRAHHQRLRCRYRADSRQQ